MIEIVGKYNVAKVFTDNMEHEAYNQIKELCDMKFAKDSKIRIMPDVHTGIGCTIGTTMTIKDKVVPNLVGVDIGCGMETVRIREKKLNLQKLDNLIYARIPSGRNVRRNSHMLADDIDLKKLKCFKHINHGRALMSIGTLGGGNHFIEASTDDEGNLYIVVHSGSRHLGNEVARYYQNEGVRTLNDSGVPKHLAYLEGKLFDNYIHDMNIIQQYAVLNRKAMMEEILNCMNLTAEERFTTTHNYIDTEKMILRKGSVSAEKGEKLLIPINMRDGSLICIGKGNADWNYSAPHGAGRIMSRRQAKQVFSLNEFKREMEGIFTTSINKDTLDECPMAYKDMDEIIKHVGDTVEIVKNIRPIYNFKAAE